MTIWPNKQLFLEHFLRGFKKEKRKWKKVSEWNSPKLATDLRSRLPAGRSFKQRVSAIDIDTLSTKKR